MGTRASGQLAYTALTTWLRSPGTEAHPASPQRDPDQGEQGIGKTEISLEWRPRRRCIYSVRRTSYKYRILANTTYPLARNPTVFFLLAPHTLPLEGR